MTYRVHLAAAVCAATVLMGVTVLAQAPAAPPQQTDYSQVQIKVTRLSGGFHTLEGSGGMMADGFTRATWWVPSTDDPLRRFLVSAGWAPDGAHREVGSEDGVATVKMIRMHTALTDADADPDPDA